jgi:uncharacterized protein (UPF0333 family)
VNLFRHLFNPKMLLPAIAVVAAGLLSYATIVQNPARAATCDPANDIINCGYTTPTDLANKVQASGELQTIYNHAFTSGWGLGDLNAFKTNAKHATVFKDGRVVLDDGTVIGTAANSLGRQKFNDQRQPITIGGTTYYFSPTTASFASGSLGAYVLVNDDHSLKFAALTACGNPVWANSPGYKCDMLNQTKVSDSTYEFTTNITNPSALTQLVYDFGDGKTQTVTSDFTQKVTHTYAPGHYTAKVTAFFNINGQEKSDTRAECTKPVDVPQPPKPIFVCDSLTAAPVAGSTTKFTFTITGHSDNATLKSGSIDFGDQQSASDLQPATPTTVIAPHEYAKAGHYVANAHLVYDQGTTTEACQAQVDIAQPPTPPSTPPALPSTGPVEIIGSAVGLGTAVGATAYYGNSRRNLIAQMLKKR